MDPQCLNKEKKIQEKNKVNKKKKVKVRKIHDILLPNK